MLQHIESETVSIAFSEQVDAALPGLVGERLAAGEARLHRAVMSLLERPLLQHALELTGGNQVRAARLLGINRNTLRKKLRALGLHPSPRSEGSPLVSP